MADTSYASNALKSSGGPSISMIDKSNSGAVGVGTYKGVMLCNRPFAGTEGLNIYIFYCRIIHLLFYIYPYSIKQG